MKQLGSLFVVGLLLALPLSAFAQEPGVEIETADVDIMSGGQAYASYVAAPAEGGPYPGIVLIHSFRGMEDGYYTMVDQFAAEGFVVLAVGWQTFEQSPADATVEQILRDGIAFLSARDDVDAERLGLTGFCAGGRYTMLFLPQIDDFAAGVAWYGFPNNGDPAPAAVIDQLDAPMLIIHGTADSASPIDSIYGYAGSLTAAGKYFELKVYYGEPHGFMLANSQLRTDDVASDAFSEMVDFFHRKLGEM
jgi:carboxymethylenebutenolidase